MRVFIGIPFPEELKEKITDWQEEMNILPVRFISLKNLHITLIPPWNEENIDTLMQMMSTIHTHPEPISLTYEKIEFAPSKKPRLIWASGSTPPALLDMRKNIYTHLKKNPQKNEFKLHTTLARFKEKDFPSFPVKKLDEKIDWKMTVDSFVLYQSRLSPTGSDYTILTTIHL